MLLNKNLWKNSLIERKQGLKETITTLKIKFFIKMPKILFEL